MESKSELIDSRINEASSLLKRLKLPEAQTNKRSAMVLLALAGLKARESWSTSSNQMYTTRDIMDFIRDEYNVEYAANSRETIRRQTLHQFEQACLIIRNDDEPQRPTNSGKNNYRLSPKCLDILKSHGSNNCQEKIDSYINSIGSLRDEYEQRLDIQKVEVRLPGGKAIKLSPGEHNELHRAIVEEFLPRFGGSNPEVLYIGDTASSRNEGGKMLHLEAQKLNQIGIPPLSHDKLPDVVAVDHERKWVLLIEAVTSHGPVSPKRIKELAEMLQGCSYGSVFVTAFPDMNRFKKYSNDIAWDTEVWLSEIPDHMIHFNGDRFLGPR